MLKVVTFLTELSASIAVVFKQRLWLDIVAVLLTVVSNDTSTLLAQIYRNHRDRCCVKCMHAY